MGRKKKDDFNQIDYQNEYNKQKYDRVCLMLPKGRKDELKAMAAQQGLSLNAFISHIIDEATK